MSGGTISGYGMADIVRGKVQPFMYLVGLTRNGEVNDIDVLEYREAYGGEIAYQSFLAQFNKKTSRDELTPGRTIKNISGATISVRSITFGIRRVLATFDIIEPRL
jgi:Na+-translocating ferredoxin:NAD+ oxidoreductase RnfG subunit